MCKRRRIAGLLTAAALLNASGAMVQAQSTTADSKSLKISSSINKYALLIGIDIYQPAGTKITVPADAPKSGRFASELYSFPDLKGPKYDVQAMHDLLVSARFGFPDKNVDVMDEKDATHDGMLARIQKDLIDDRKAGDTVVLYISSHGSLRVNKKSNAQAFDLEGDGQTPTPLDSTIVPNDAYKGGEDILSNQLRHMFTLAANKGVHVTAIFDSCHSGGQARGAPNPAHVPRDVAWDPRDLDTPPEAGVAPEDRTDNPVLVLSAAQKDQSAMDVQDTNPPHGLFTAALLQTLEALPPDAPAVDVFRRVALNMEIGGADNQQPALDASSVRKQQPLFGGDSPATATVTSVGKDGLVLAIKPAAAVGPGSEFTAVLESNGVKTVLRSKETDSQVRSEAHAVVLSPTSATLKVGDNFLMKAPLRATVVKKLDEAHVLLDIGPASDIGKGTEFTAINESNGVTTVLRIEDAESLVRSRAVVVSPANAVVKPLDVFEVNVTKWVPAERPTMKFYAGAATLPQAEIDAAAAVLSAANTPLVEDPSSDAWGYRISWDGKQWTMVKKRPPASASRPTTGKDKALPAEELGAKLDAAKIAKAIAALNKQQPDPKNAPTASAVWFEPPLPTELVAGLLQDKTSAAQITGDRAQARYVAAGVKNSNGLAYAWYDRGSFDEDVQTPSGYGRGCSPNSAYPLRTDWVKGGDSTDAATQLNGAANKLAKLNGWLTLQSMVSGSQDYPYKLTLVRASDHQPVDDGKPTYKDERYSLALSGSIDATTNPRWVYVLGIDCQGSGALLWPQTGPGARFPSTDHGRLAMIPLPDMTFRITPPFGTDTFILLTTSTALPEPDVLNFEGVVRGGTRGVDNPLEDLLRETSSATRGMEHEAPTDWSVATIQMHSQPVKAPANAAQP